MLVAGRSGGNALSNVWEVNGFMGKISVIGAPYTNITHMFKFVIGEGTLGFLGLTSTEQ